MPKSKNTRKGKSRPRNTVKNDINLRNASRMVDDFYPLAPQLDFGSTPKSNRGVFALFDEDMMVDAFMLENEAHEADERAYDESKVLVEHLISSCKQGDVAGVDKYSQRVVDSDLYAMSGEYYPILFLDQFVSLLVMEAFQNTENVETDLRWLEIPVAVSTHLDDFGKALVASALTTLGDSYSLEEKDSSRIEKFTSTVGASLPPRFLEKAPSEEQLSSLLHVYSSLRANYLLHPDLVTEDYEDFGMSPFDI